MRLHLCIACSPDEPVVRVSVGRPGRSLNGPVVGEAGASAAREHQRRTAARAYSARARLGDTIGSAYLFLTDDPQTTRSWGVGTEGERAVGRLLDARAAADFIVLHDRRIPGTKTNLDHIVVTHDAVFVIDTKRYRGRVEMRNWGNILFPDRRLYVAGRDKSKLVQAASRQAGIVKQTLNEAGRTGCPVVPVLCFVESDWSLLPRPLLFDHVRVVWSKGLVKLVEKTKSSTPLGTIDIASDIAAALPAA